ncbi:MAG: helix-turn-helix transcriptional regulator [Vagococcus sp.]
MGDRLISISDVSKNTGVSRSALTNFYYRKNKMIKYETLIKICDFLQIPLSELIEYQPKKEGE